MITEDTVYGGEETRFDMPADEKNDEKTVTGTGEEKSAPAPKKGKWKKVAVGAGTGIVFGAAAAVLTGGTPDQEIANHAGGAHNGGSETVTPPIADESIAMATGVNDEMSFSQAFGAARAEVGAGGAFQWHGQTYSTYYAEEWDSMTPEQQAEYNNHFTWSSQGGGNTGTTQAATDTAADTAGPAQDVHPDAGSHSAGREEVAQEPNPGAGTQEEIAGSEVAVVGEPAQEIEVLGVVYDAEADMNVGAMTVDGQEVLLIDVDVDGDGRISEAEIADISDQNITVDDLGGLPPVDDGLMAEAGGPDYINDGGCYDA